MARKWTQVWLQSPCCSVPGEGTPLAKLWYLRGHLWPFCMSGGPQTNGDCSLQTRILVTLSGKRSHELLQSQKEIKSSWAGSFSHGWSQCRLSIPLSPAKPLSSFLHITSLHAYLSCPTLCNPMDCSPPGSSVHGTLQARILEWVAISSSRGFSQPRDRTRVSCTGGQILYHCTTWKAAHPS